MWRLVKAEGAPYFLCLETGAKIRFQQKVKMDIFEGFQKSRGYEVVHEMGNKLLVIGHEEGEIEKVIHKWQTILKAV